MRIVECTPQYLRCGIGACPCVFRAEDGTLVIVGRKITSSEARRLRLSKRIGKQEAAIIIHADYLKDAIR